MNDGVGARPYPTKKPPLSTADLWISISVLALTALMGAVATVGGLFSLAFLDYCPPESCSASGASSAVLTSLLVAAVLAIVGLIITVIALVRRRRAWPFAVGTLVACAVVLLVGVIGYMAATGMTTAPPR